MLSEKNITRSSCMIFIAKNICVSLQPENILLSRDNKIKIGDFGLATSGIDDLFVTRTENRGTRSYMAPEQVILFTSNLSACIGSSYWVSNLKLKRFKTRFRNLDKDLRFGLWD